MFLIGLFASILSKGQSVLPNDSIQVKVEYSINYEKLPFKMKLMKKLLPNTSISYYSHIGNRTELNINGNLMGKEIISSTVIIQNYLNATMSINVSAVINDSIIDNIFKNEPIPQKPISNISFYETKKDIQGYECRYFISENDSIKTEGFFTDLLSGVGEFENIGLPLDYKTIHKKEKYTTITKAQKIIIEPFNENEFIISD